MNSKYSKDYVITPGICDWTVKLGIADTFSLFMDIASEHADELGIGTQFMAANNMFWLTVRSRVHFIKRPGMMKRVKVSTWPLEADGLRCIRDYMICSEEGEVLCEGKTEWTVLDMSTGRPVKMENVYPEGLEILKEKLLPEPFFKVKEDFEDAEILGSYRIRSVDIDLGGHMNNVAYIRAMLGMLPSKRIKEMNITNVEVTYRKSCYEGEMLDFRMRTLNEPECTYEIGALNKDGKAVFLAKIW